MTYVIDHLENHNSVMSPRLLRVIGFRCLKGDFKPFLGLLLTTSTAGNESDFHRACIYRFSLTSNSLDENVLHETGTETAIFNSFILKSYMGALK